LHNFALEKLIVFLLHRNFSLLIILKLTVVKITFGASAAATQKNNNNVLKLTVIFSQTICRFGHV